MKTSGAAVVVAALSVASTLLAAEPRKVVLLAGPPSHGPGEHEHRAGCLLLKACLDKVPGVVSEVYSNGWPQNPEAAFAGAATVVIYSDGGAGHPFLRNDHLETVGALMKKGVGLGLPSLRCGANQGGGREGVPGLAGRVFRARLVGQPNVAAGVQAAAHPPHHARGAPVPGDRRMVFPHALPRGQPGHAANPLGRGARQHDGPTRRAARRQPGGARGGEARRAAGSGVGVRAAGTAGAASATPAATSTATGATTMCASWC